LGLRKTVLPYSVHKEESRIIEGVYKIRYTLVENK